MAHYEMINEPKNPVYAIGHGAWRRLINENRVVEVPGPDTNVIEIEIWNYDPGICTTNEIVDKLSLVLSFRDNNDERIEIACDKIIKNMDW